MGGWFMFFQHHHSPRHSIYTIPPTPSNSVALSQTLNCTYFSCTSSFGINSRILWNVSPLFSPMCFPVLHRATLLQKISGDRTPCSEYKLSGVYISCHILFLPALAFLLSRFCKWEEKLGNNIPVLCTWPCTFCLFCFLFPFAFCFSLLPTAMIHPSGGRLPACSIRSLLFYPFLSFIHYWFSQCSNTTNPLSAKSSRN